MLISTELTDYYQDLFNHLHAEHGLIPIISEMDEIIRISLAVVQKIDALAGKPSFKQQIIDAFNDGYREGEQDIDAGVTPFKDVSAFCNAEDYWQRTYGTT